MSVRLIGPFQLDLQNPARGAEQAARASLRGEVVRDPAVEVANTPGLYGLVSEPAGGGPRLVGIWALLDERWIEDGPPSGTAQIPPIVGALLHAFVEASWWRSLPNERGLGPMVVLEWDARLAARSSFAPDPVSLNIPTTL